MLVRRGVTVLAAVQQCSAGGIHAPLSDLLTFKYVGSCRLQGTFPQGTLPATGLHRFCSQEQCTGGLLHGSLLSGSAPGLCSKYESQGTCHSYQWPGCAAGFAEGLRHVPESCDLSTYSCTQNSVQHALIIVVSLCPDCSSDAQLSLQQSICLYARVSALQPVAYGQSNLTLQQNIQRAFFWWQWFCGLPAESGEQQALQLTDASAPEPVLNTCVQAVCILVLYSLLFVALVTRVTHLLKNKPYTGKAAGPVKTCSHIVQVQAFNWEGKLPHAAQVASPDASACILLVWLARYRAGLD